MSTTSPAVDVQDESLADVDLAAVYAMPVEEPAQPAPRRKRRKFRKYPRPECTAAERQALMELQQGRCGICGEAFPEKDLMTDHSYRTGKTGACFAASTMPRWASGRTAPRCSRKHWPI
jgi:Recombination endonuclease VII